MVLPVTPVGGGQILRLRISLSVRNSFFFSFIKKKKNTKKHNFLGVSLATSSSLPQGFTHLKAVDLTLGSLSNKSDEQEPNALWLPRLGLT